MAINRQRRERSKPFNTFFRFNSDYLKNLDDCIALGWKWMSLYLQVNSSFWFFTVFHYVQLITLRFCACVFIKTQGLPGVGLTSTSGH